MIKTARKPRTIWASFLQALLRCKFMRRVRLGLELLEERITPVGDFRFQASGAGALTLRQAGGDLQIVDTDAPSVVQAAKPLSDITGGVRIEANGFNVNLTIDASVPQVVGGITFAGSGGATTPTPPTPYPPL